MLSYLDIPHYILKAKQYTFYLFTSWKTAFTTGNVFKYYSPASPVQHCFVNSCNVLETVGLVCWNKRWWWGGVFLWQYWCTLQANLILSSPMWHWYSPVRFDRDIIKVEAGCWYCWGLQSLSHFHKQVERAVLSEF